MSLTKLFFILSYYGRSWKTKKKDSAFEFESHPKGPKIMKIWKVKGYLDLAYFYGKILQILLFLNNTLHRKYFLRQKIYIKMKIIMKPHCMVKYLLKYLIFILMLFINILRVFPAFISNIFLTKKLLKWSISHFFRNFKCSDMKQKFPINYANLNSSCGREKCSNLTLI